MRNRYEYGRGAKETEAKGQRADDEEEEEEEEEEEDVPGPAIPPTITGRCQQEGG